MAESTGVKSGLVHCIGDTVETYSGELPSVPVLRSHCKCSQFRASVGLKLKSRSVCVCFVLFWGYFLPRVVPSCCPLIGSWCQSMWWSPSPCGRRTCHSRSLDREAMSVCWPSREMSTEFLHYALTAPLCSVRTHRWDCLEAWFTCPCPLWPLR